MVCKLLLVLFETDPKIGGPWFQPPPLRFRGDLFLKNQNLRGYENKISGLRGEISLRGNDDCTFDKILDHHQPHLKQTPKDML